MALIRPVVGADISAETFGQPVYDAVAATPWTNLPLVNGWFVYQHAQYRKVGDMVQLRGWVVPASTNMTTFATLPAGYRPPVEVQISTSYYRGGYYLIAVGILPSGAMAPTVNVASQAAVSILGAFSTTP